MSAGSSFVLTPPSDDKKYAYTITPLNQTDVDRIAADHPKVANYRTTPSKSSRETDHGYFVFEIHVHFGCCDDPENGEITLVLQLPREICYCGLFKKTDNMIEIDMAPVAMYLYKMQIPVLVGQSMLRTMLNSAMRQMPLVPKVDDPDKIAGIPEAVKILILSLKQGDEEDVVGKVETRSFNNFVERVKAYRSNDIKGLKIKYGDCCVDDAVLVLYNP